MALYSASKLDLEMVAYFLALHDIRLESKKIANPPVEHLSCRHPAESTSEKALTRKELVLVILSPSLTDDFKYLMILFTATQWCSVGACKYWQTLFTAKLISGLVKDRYWSAPTMLR
jgi:hypothetical protein